MEGNNENENEKMESVNLNKDAIEPTNEEKQVVEEQKVVEEKVNVQKVEPVNVQPVKEPPMAEAAKINQPQQHNQGPKQQADGTNIAALVLGIVSLVLWCFWFISIPCGVIAFILGIMGLKKNGRGMAISGIVTSSICIVIWLLVFIFAFIGGLIYGINSSTVYPSRSSYYDYFDIDDFLDF